jgi:hypothetical protein
VIFLKNHTYFKLGAWLTPVILTTQEAEIRRIKVPSHPLANSSQDPFSKKPITKRVFGVAQVVRALA